MFQSYFCAILLVGFYFKKLGSETRKGEGRRLCFQAIDRTYTHFKVLCLYGRTDLFRSLTSNLSPHLHSLAFGAIRVAGTLCNHDFSPDFFSTGCSTPVLFGNSSQRHRKCSLRALHCAANPLPLISSPWLSAVSKKRTEPPTRKGPPDVAVSVSRKNLSFCAVVLLPPFL